MRNGFVLANLKLEGELYEQIKAKADAVGLTVEDWIVLAAAQKVWEGDGATVGSWSRN